MVVSMFMFMVCFVFDLVLKLIGKQDMVQVVSVDELIKELQCFDFKIN